MSERTYDKYADDLNDCRGEVVDIRQDRDECHGKTEALKLTLRDRGSEVQALRMERDDLRDAVRDAQSRPQWLTVVATGAAALLVGGVVGWAAF